MTSLNKKLNMLFLLIFIPITGISLSGCKAGKASSLTITSGSGSSDTALPVEIALPRNENIFATYNTTANIESDEEAPVVARVSAEIVEILTEEGQRVQAGQILARQDGRRLRLELAQAAATLNKTRQEYDRNVMLHNKGLVSAGAFENLEYEVTALEAAWELKQLELDYTVIRAPISGVISARYAKVGNHGARNSVMFDIIDTSSLIAYLHIPEVELDKFTTGINVALKVDAIPRQTFSAVVTRISPTINADSGTFKMTAAINNLDGELVPGMFGHFDIAYEKHDCAITIPATAIIAEDNSMIVFIAQDGVAIRRVVKTGIRSGSRVEILEGLSSNDSIVISGSSGLRNGSPIRGNSPPRFSKDRIGI